MGWDWINDIVVKLRKTYLTNSPYELCNCLKIIIERVEPSYYLLANNKSMYFKNFCGNSVIFIRNDLYGKEEEFILCHELGHSILHPTLSCSKYANKGKIDRQADYFAFALKGITFDLIEMQNMTLKQMASCVEVPYEPLSQLVNL